MRTFLLKTALLLLGLCSVLDATAQTREYLTVDGKQRTMLVYVPKNLPENAPLVITLHGFNQSAQYQMDNTAWNRVAESEKFIVVYPDYDGGWWDVNGTKDTRFIEEIMKVMNQRYKSDLNRVYVSGFSLGAMMTYHCIEVLANKVAAFAPVSGVRFDNKAPVSPRVVPIIHTHCKGDDVFKWGGDPQHASGGYPYIPDYVKSWAVYFGMNPEPEFIDPYKANDVDLTIYRSPNTVAEVRLLSFDGAGHWHVDADGWGGVSTTWEIWNFCKRYTLDLNEVTPPQLVSISPEDKSFDLPETQREFLIKLDKEPLESSITAKLVGNGKTINLVTEVPQPDCDCPADAVVCGVPDGVEIPAGDYTLTIDGLCTAKGPDFTRSLSFEYTYGYEETGDKMNVETVFDPNLHNAYIEQGECVPIGWIKEGGESCLKNAGYDAEAGIDLEYAAGLYLSAGDDASSKLTYGKTTGYLVNLPVGKYVLSFRSAYWDKGSQRGKATFNVTVNSKSNRGGYLYPVKETDIVPAGFVSEEKEGWAATAARHEYTMNITKKDNYVFNFEIAKPKVKVFVGKIKVTTAPSNADKYKGEFLRMMTEAKNLYANVEQYLPESTDNFIKKAATLKAVIDKYEGLVSTAPSAYTAAMEELYAAMEPLYQKPTSDAIAHPAAVSTLTSTEYYSTDGRRISSSPRISSSSKGIVIERNTANDGKKTVRKFVRK